MTYAALPSGHAGRSTESVHHPNGRFAGVVALESNAVIQADVKAAVHGRASYGAALPANDAAAWMADTLDEAKAAFAKAMLRSRG